MITRMWRALGDRWLWFRHSYSFQFAHGPLCDRHRHNAVRLGHVFVCRSCLSLYATLVVSLGVLLAWQPGAGLLLGMLIGTAAITTFLSWPPLYRHLPRALKDGIRAGAGLWGAVCLALAFAGAWITAGVGAAVLLGVFLAFSEVRNRQRKTMCEGCPELSEEGVCSGYARQAASMRVYEDAMSARMAPRVETMLRDRSK